MLKDAYLDAKIDFDTAENEPREVGGGLQKFGFFSQNLDLFNVAVTRVIIERWPHAYGDERLAFDTLYDSYQLEGAEEAVEIDEQRAEILDLDNGAVR